MEKQKILPISGSIFVRATRFMILLLKASGSVGAYQDKPDDSRHCFLQGEVLVTVRTNPFVPISAAERVVLATSAPFLQHQPSPPSITTPYQGKEEKPIRIQSESV
ncbi:hypothetical protein [Brevibacillus centrosporus]|uniref:hypothetical protein n=1 Tax=Brevibacillus centrosporus TaxID=54910 RepID=UPI000B8519B8|nr:hypothetical protein [Brevibacillus centrosporus]MEC2128747.1 hypothetical protein [Brevibacillus centrosporus]MED4910386.1 hypothetical protein [Brevibacillus centrosporus]RNB71388.1 hypothetical protein EDM55_08620 [Brevibacillus centrosporus]